MSLVMGKVARRRLAVGLGLCLALTSIGPGVAIACEGKAEESASLTPIEWGEGAIEKGEACPTEGVEVKFEPTGKWCEYGLKNTNTTEAIKLKAKEVNVKNRECEEILCVAPIPGVAAFQSECRNVVELGAGTECRERIEYKKRPAEPHLIGYEWALESRPSGAKFFVEKFQKVK